MGKIGRPEQEQEAEIQALREWAEAEERDIQRSAERRKIARLSAEEAKARDAGDLEKARHLSDEIVAVGREIRRRFGY